MDLITFDVSGVPEALARPGAMIELIGPHQPVDALAAEAGTIGYEILTALGARCALYTPAELEGRRMDAPLQLVGRFVLGFLANAGGLVLFAVAARSATAFGRPSTGAVSLRQLIDIGYYSLPVVGLTAIFTGMVLALQSYTGFARFSAESAIANVVVVSLTRELGPVLAGLMVAGPHRRLHGRRDRHHAGHRADRRAIHAVDQPVEVPGGAAPDRRRS